MLTYHQTTENEKYEINDWKYSGDYAIYNNPPYEEQKKTGRGFANPANHFYSFYDNEASSDLSICPMRDQKFSLASVPTRTIAAKDTDSR